MIRVGNYPEGLTAGQIKTCVDYMTAMHPEIKNGRLDIEADGEDVDLTLTSDAGVPFQRIRRITGYLTGDVGRWNNAKKAELDDRVKHSI